jgi:hypothetical protein
LKANIARIAPMPGRRQEAVMDPVHKSFASLRGAIAGGLLVALAACGGGGSDPTLSSPSVALQPSVRATLPDARTPPLTGEATSTLVRATFNKPMNAATITTSTFTLACPAGTPVAATVAYQGVSATLTPTLPLPPNTTCVATLSTAVQDSTGIALASAYTWSFVTGIAVARDRTPPTVVVTVPALGAAGVATNTRISATFSEAMNAAQINAATFTLHGASGAVVGSVSYDAASRTATFTPITPATLRVNSLYTATVDAFTTDVVGVYLDGNTSLGDHVWTFTTGIARDDVGPAVVTVNPIDTGSDICRSKGVGATFSEPMDAATINATTFTVTDAGVAVAGSVSYDAPSQVVTFVPTAATGFAASRTFVVTVASGATGVKDLAGNPLAANRVWSFTTGTQACLSAVNLGTTASFGAFGGATGVTNQGINTLVRGDLGTTGACTLVTGLHEWAGSDFTETPLNKGTVRGTIYCGPPDQGFTRERLAIATQARADAQTAYDALAAMPPGSDPGAGQLGGLVLTPGVYTAAVGTFDVTSGDLTLDARGDVNAVWVFQSAAALTVGLSATPRSVMLVNGAQARNVFWQVGSAARIEDGSTMVGTIVALAGVTISTAGQTVQTTLIGRALGLTGSVTMVNATVVAP